MKAFETSATVQPQGDVRVAGVPFAPGTEVEILISPKRTNAAEFAQAWQRVTAELRQLAPTDSISDDDIKQEIDNHRSGR